MVDTLPSAQKAPAQVAAADAGDPATPYTSVAKDPVALMDKLRSYSSVQAVTEQLQRGGYTWKADNLVKPGRRNYPPYRTDTLTIAGYRHLGQEGQLTLEFFNDRLYETNFAPANAESYLRILRKQGVPLRREESGRSQMTQGALHVETNIDFAVSDVGRQLHITPYIYWRDLRLMQQLKDWGPLN